MTLVSVTAYHSFGGEVEASNTPTIRRLTPSCRHQLPRIAPSARSISCSGRSIDERSPAVAFSARNPRGDKYMSETLAEKTCTPCRGGIPPLTRDEAQRFQAQAPNWELGDNAHSIQRTFQFRNFREALT